MQGVAFALVFEHVRVGLAEHGFVEALAEAFAGLGHFLVYLLVEFGYGVFDEHVGAIAFLGILVVDEGVVESVYVARCLPDGGVHEDGGVNAHDVVVEHGHCFPPVSFDVVFEFYAVLAVVVHGREAVIKLA